MAKKQVSTGGSGAAFTDTRRVEELVALMAANGLTEIELVEDKSRIVLRRGGHSGGGGAAPAMAPAHTHVTPAAHSPIAAPPVAATPVDENAGLVAIKSPMVGTYYASPNPESDAFVTIGAQVDEKTVVCIIEAMKVFNEIHAEVRGTIARMMVSNGQAVEYGQPLYMVKPG